MHARYPGPVGGDNLESRFGLFARSPGWGSIIDQGFGRTKDLVGVWIDTGLPKTDVGWYGKGDTR